MKAPFRSIGRHAERGAVAIEMAFALPVLLVFLGLPSILLAFYFRQYSAAQKAVHDAALYLAMAPRVELTTPGSDGLPAALTLAKKIVSKEMAGLIPAGMPPTWDTLCEYRVGGSPAVKSCAVVYLRDPSHTLVQFDVSMGFNYINPLTGADTGILIAPYVPVRYLGN